MENPWLRRPVFHDSQRGSEEVPVVWGLIGPVQWKSDIALLSGLLLSLREFLGLNKTPELEFGCRSTLWCGSGRYEVASTFFGMEIC